VTQGKAEQELFDQIEIGRTEDLGAITFTREQLEDNRKALDWPEAPFPVLHGPRHDDTADRKLFPHRVNARSIRKFYNPPVPGKKIKLTVKVTDKYRKGDIPYLVEEVTAIDEDGRLIETMTVHQLLRTKRVGEKWA
jgi:hypothetical protein